ncbi:HAD-IIIA family hydrolase [Bordetella genomosp. 10]|uniref:HAD-IIIA family hydrolase n=1 Tax=Bordetella genomosp. 10 TaxID=1416804 RepID=UPI000B9E6805|nr:HAD-IIIA family hydrolase [Bordetella genomosp. 10]
MKPQRAPTQAVILVGGLGSRLGELTRNYPKPLLPVAGKPFLDLVIWHLARYGFRQVLLLAGHGAKVVEQYAAESAFRDRIAIDIVIEPAPMGTAGALSFARDKLDDIFLLTNGDSIFDFNWLDLHTRFALQPEALISMGLRRLPDASRFGAVVLDGHRVKGFQHRGSGDGGLVNGGVYCMRKELLAELPARGSLEQEVMPRLATMGKICGKEYSGFFLDIGVPESYAVAETTVWESRVRPAIFFDRDGVLNIDKGYVGQRERFEWQEDAIAAVKLANDQGYFVFVVTNQAGIARGYYTEADMMALHRHMQGELRANGAHIDDIRFCPHHVDGSVKPLAIDCECRKPKPAMLLALLDTWPAAVSDSILIGDKTTDIDAANAAGIRGHLYTEGSLSDCVKALICP